MSIQQLNTQIEQLNAEKWSSEKVWRRNQSVEEMKRLAQQTADTVQAEANQLLKEAKNGEKLIQEAETIKWICWIYRSGWMNWRRNRSSLISRLPTNEKCFELETECEEILASKERYSKEAQALKQEFIAMRSNLIDRYVKGLDEFLEENQLFKHLKSEESTKSDDFDHQEIG